MATNRDEAAGAIGFVKLDCSDQPPIMGSMASTIPMPRAASTGNAQMCVYLYRMAHLPTRRYGQDAIKVSCM
jgi:hypothetical protein